MRKNKNKLLVLMMFCMGAINAQSLEYLYKNLPDNIDPLLTYKERNEMVEYMKSNQIDTVRNKLGGVAYFLKYDTLHNSVVVRNTSTSLFEMRIINRSSHQPFIAVINSVQGPVLSSSISFYDMSWRTLPMKFVMPRSVEWIDESLLTSAVNVDHAWVRNSMSLNFVSLKFADDSPVLIAENHATERFNEEDGKKVKPFVLSQSILYEYKEDAWVKMKK